jgi:hypothetical protein
VWGRGGETSSTSSTPIAASKLTLLGSAAFHRAIAGLTKADADIPADIRRYLAANTRSPILAFSSCLAGMACE